MKNIIKLICICFLASTVSCEFLNVVPNDTATLDHAFSNRSVAEKFLRTCYSHLPDPCHPTYYPAYLTSRDELCLDRDSRVYTSPAYLISIGLQNTDNPLLNYWSGNNIGYFNNDVSNPKPGLYVAIRDCNIFLNNIDKPRDMLEEERSRWIGEVKFLKAYYHFFLMMLYGPVVIADEEVPLSTSPSDLFVYREPVDECVDYIVKLLDEAIALLPPVLYDPLTEQGRISATIALAVKAKVLTWAASPLFNGNPDYANWIDNRGKRLISNTYDQGKWVKAATAIREAIDVCQAAGLQLYTFNKFASPQTYNMNDTITQLMEIRKAISEDLIRNPGIIWATQEQFSSKLPVYGLATTGNLLNSLFPYMYAEDQAAGIYGTFEASWHMGELFYTNNGVPIDEDKGFDYEGRFNLRRAQPTDNHQFYIATGETTVELNFNREPRFYADLTFDRGYVELASTTTNGGASFSPFIRARGGEIFVYSSYIPKKIHAFDTSASQGIAGRTYIAYDYRFPLFRMADLYLLYAEALNEVKDQPDTEVHYWIDLIRNKVGLNGVAESWANHSTNPGKPFTKDGMRAIIQRERMIELAFEGQRYWDVRRWKTAEQYWSLPSMMWNASSTSTTAELYYIPTVRSSIPARQVSFKDLLYPIRNYDMRVNPNLEQTYGW